MDIDIAQLIGSIGLPGAICLYTLMTLNKTLASNTRVLSAIAGKLGVNDKGDGQ